MLAKEYIEMKIRDIGNIILNHGMLDWELLRTKRDELKALRDASKLLTPDMDISNLFDIVTSMANSKETLIRNILFEIPVGVDLIEVLNLRKEYDILRYIQRDIEVLIGEDKRS